MISNTLLTLFITPVHIEIDRLVNQQLPDDLRLGPDALQFIGSVQADVDLLTVWNPSKGGVFRNPRHVHAVRHIGGDDPKVCEEVAAKKNLSKPNSDQGCKVDFQDLIDLSEEVAVDDLSTLIRETQGNLNSQQVGSVLYVLGTFFHYYQDLKHLDPPLISWRDHIVQPIGKDKKGGRQHLVTDAFPTEKIKSDATERTVRFSQQFWKRVKEKVNDEEYFKNAFLHIRNFKIEPRKKVIDYEPSNYSKIFPSYEGKLPSRWDSFVNVYSGVNFTSGNFQLGLSLGKSWRFFERNRFQGWIGGSANVFYESRNNVSFIGKIELGLVPMTAVMLTVGSYGKASRSFLPDRTNTTIEAGFVARLESPVLTALLCENCASFGVETQVPFYSSSGLSTPAVLGVAYVALP